MKFDVLQDARSLFLTNYYHSDEFLTHVHVYFVNASGGTWPSL